MAAPAELTGEPIPEPTGPQPPGPDQAAEARDTADEDVLAVADPELAPAPPASDPGRARGMSPLAVAAVVFGIVALAGVAVGALAVATHGFRAKNVIHYRLAAVFSLRPGDCINSAPNGLAVTVLSCAKPHDAEVFATFPLSASSWPGVAAVQSQASNGCLSRIAGYLNPQLANAGLAQEYFYPNEEAWQAGVRTVVCEISAPSGQLTGSVRGPG